MPSGRLNAAGGAARSDFVVRPAVSQDVKAIRDLTARYVEQGVLVAKAPVSYYESVPDFLVAASGAGQLVGCGAVHVMWNGLGEIRTLATDPLWQGRGVGGAIVRGLVARARALGLERLFCLTFEVGFFAARGFAPIQGIPVTQKVYEELLRSHDDGIAEFLDLARVKPNTLGNTRMLRQL
ncbi:MAG: amino-acid N-acetyltransferase [Bifidobacteriaceae bacterium]|jgi:amino-acid N-acetyltransferase|nr:amino-acid N-acetyltransferase [Bifidobacteriaceae bacterium]